MANVKKIERIVKREGRVHTVPAEATVVAAANEMRQSRVGCLIVTDERDRVVGILTERDIIRQVVATGADPSTTHVSAIMTPNVLCCTMDTSILKARKVMAQRGIRHLPIIENGAPVGMISSRDIIAHQLTETEAVVQRQSKLLQDLEQEHPGIANLERDTHGRLVI